MTCQTSTIARASLPIPDTGPTCWIVDEQQVDEQQASWHGVSYPWFSSLTCCCRHGASRKFCWLPRPPPPSPLRPRPNPSRSVPVPAHRNANAADAAAVPRRTKIPLQSRPVTPSPTRASSKKATTFLPNVHVALAIRPRPCPRPASICPPFFACPFSSVNPGRNSFRPLPFITLPYPCRLDPPPPKA